MNTAILYTAWAADQVDEPTIGEIRAYVDRLVMTKNPREEALQDLADNDEDLIDWGEAEKGSRPADSAIEDNNSYWRRQGICPECMNIPPRPESDE